MATGQKDPLETWVAQVRQDTGTNILDDWIDAIERGTGIRLTREEMVGLYRDIAKILRKRGVEWSESEQRPIPFKLAS